MAWPEDDPFPITDWEGFWQRLEFAHYIGLRGLKYLGDGRRTFAAITLRSALEATLSAESWLGKQLSEPTVMSDDAILAAVFRALQVRRDIALSEAH